MGAAEGLTDLEQRVLGQVDPDRLVALASDLVAVPSVSTDERPALERTATELDRIGMSVETWEVDLARLVADDWYSAEFERTEMLGVVGRIGGDGPSLLLDGHVDVVPPGLDGDWRTPPFEPAVRDGRLYGRGACDMKGGLAAAIHAVEAVGRAGVTLAGSVVVAPVAAEEDGGSGTLALLRHGVTADGCVIMEPTDLAVVPAVAGALSWRITIRGLSAHGCLREEGVSAIEAFVPVHRAVLDLEERRNASAAGGLFGWLDRPFAICGGRIAGGDWPSSEADWLTWEGRYGVAPGEDLAAARAELEAAVAAAAAADPWLADHPPVVEWVGGQFYPGETDPGEPIVTVVREAAGAAHGAPPDLRGMPYGCDLGLTLNVGGIPTVVYGPGDIRDAHRPDESVGVDDLVTAARTLALTTLRFCGTA